MALDMTPEAIERRERWRKVWIDSDRRKPFAVGTDTPVPGSLRRLGLPTIVQRGGFPAQKCWDN